MTLANAIDDLIRAFSESGMDQPQFEARSLVQACLGLTFSQLMSHPDRELPADHAQKLAAWKAERLRGVPLAYLSKHKGFYKYDFIVEPGVLVPRPETEMVVETAMRRIDERSAVFTVADLGCGTGCIGLSLISEMTELMLWGVDLSPKACELTLRNAAALGVKERVKVEAKRVEEWVPGLTFDVIVANPPYIAENDPLVQPSVKQHEPYEALFAGEDGLEAVRAWTVWAYKHMKSKGIFVCEIGAGQSRSVQDLFAKVGFESIQVDRDLAGHERVISGIRTK